MYVLSMTNFIKKLWVVLLLIQFSNLFAQSSDELWTKTYGLEYDDQGRHILPTEDGGYIFLGVLENAETNSEDMWLVRLDSKGDMIWQEIYGGSLSDRGNRLIPDSNGGYLLAGYTQSYGAGGYDVWLIKINSSGVPLWQKTYGDTLDDYAFSVIPAENKGYIIAGTTTSTKYGKYDLWVFQVDSMGNLGWQTIMGGDDQDQARSIKQTSDGGYIIAGYTVTDLDRQYDLWLVKLDSNGDSLWSKTFGGNYRDAGISVLEMSDNKIMILGYTESFYWFEGVYDRDIWLLITDPEGDAIRASTFGGPYNEYGHILDITNDGNYIITGYTESVGSGGWDLLILKVDGEGNEIWSKTYGGPLKDFGKYIYQNESGGYVCIGITESFGTGGWDAWVIKTDSEGNTSLPTTSEEPFISNDSRIPINYYLLQNYPNPFNPVTTIKYSLLKSGNVKVNIYDVLGKKVKELVNKKQNAGYHQVIWNGTNMQNELVSSGIYYYQIVTEDFQDIKKMILVR
jgi:predicted secreted protein